MIIGYDNVLINQYEYFKLLNYKSLKTMFHTYCFKVIEI